jgi:outer-membrane receptor for ferric coprogen and ferric-rhodotorulic acid
LPGELNSWEVGAGLSAQSETTSAGSFPFCPSPPGACIPQVAVQPAYAVLDLRAGFDIDRNWRVALSVNNVLDKRYYESMDTPPLHGWYGEPRNWILRVDASY